MLIRLFTLHLWSFVMLNSSLHIRRTHIHIPILCLICACTYIYTFTGPNALPGSHIATPSSSDKTTEGMTARVQFPSETVEELESLIDAYDAQLPPLKNFILPAGVYLYIRGSVQICICMNI